MSREEEVLSEIKRIMYDSQELLGNHSVVLFGSRAAGTQRDRSDFDIGITGDTPLELTSFYQLEEKLDTIKTLYSIDLVDIARATNRFKGESLKHTKVLYEPTATA